MRSGTAGSRFAAVMAVGLLVVSLSACGGGGSAPEVVSQEPAGSSSSGSSSGGSSSGSPADDIRDAIPDIVGDEAQACLEIGLAYASLSLSMLGTAFGADQADVDEMTQQLADLRAEVPAEIEDDFEVFSQAMSEFGSVMTDAGGNLFDPATQQALEDAGQALETPEVKEAQANIEAYLEQNCPESAFTAGN